MNEPLSGWTKDAPGPVRGRCMLWTSGQALSMGETVMHQIMRRRYALLIVAALSGVFGTTLFEVGAQVGTGTLPEQLTDRDFWQMVVDFSETDGAFRSDNFVSNETTYQEVIPQLKKLSQPGGVYLGVGPDQNFTYVTSLSPRMAFIIDIRRQNLVQHLLYKAIIEMSEDRGDFLSRLFSRPRPAGIEEASTPKALFDAFYEVAADEALFQKVHHEIKVQLVERHEFALTEDDLRSLEYVHRAFFSEGPDLRYSFPRQRPGRWFPTYAELMMATDRTGLNHGYLATEQNFRTLREFEQRNLLVPIVGDFGGDKAIRAVGRYLKDKQATVDYFYTSNVEQYLFQGDAWRRYYSNVATLPLRETSTFIRAHFDTGFLFPPGIVTPDLHSVLLLDPMQSLLSAFSAGEVQTYGDLVKRSN